MRLRKAKVICIKQLKEIVKNKELLIQLIMFPVLAVFLNTAVKVPDMPDHFFVVLFATMYIGMAPLTCMASIIAEEKEKNTLRMLLMSDVHVAEYLSGIGICIFALCLVGAGVFTVLTGFAPGAALCFLAVMAAGILISMLLGAAIGIWSRSQMAAASVTVPVMLVFSFLPMIAQFNAAAKRISDLTYTGRIGMMLSHIGHIPDAGVYAGVILVNLAIVIAVFVAGYRRSRMI